VTQEERIQALEIIATHQRASRNQRTKRFWGKTIGEPEDIQEQTRRRMLTPAE
jgi:hypothetical protein